MYCPVLSWRMARPGPLARKLEALEQSALLAGYARSAYCSTAVEEGAMRCVVLRWDMALPGDDVSIDKVSPMLLCACYAMASTDTAYRAGSGTSAGTARVHSRGYYAGLPDCRSAPPWCYAPATRCPVLRQRMILLGLKWLVHQHDRYPPLSCDAKPGTF
eukprot:2127666-Rhodomonas_salina.4